MKITEICDLLRAELMENGYRYGFYADGRTYRPDFSKGFDEAFADCLQRNYCVQDPQDTAREKIGTCIDAVVLMKALLDGQAIPSKIWLLRDQKTGAPHTVLTFAAEGRVAYLELTPQSGKPWYGKELVYADEEAFRKDLRDRGYDAADVTERIFVGAAPDFMNGRSL